MLERTSAPANLPTGGIHLVHVVFAVVGRGSARSLGLEALGVLLYSAVAWLGFRQSIALLALGWAMHVVWDVALHLHGAGAEYTPVWYPWGCVSFDLVVAGAVLTAGGRARPSLRVSWWPAVTRRVRPPHRPRHCGPW